MLEPVDVVSEVIQIGHPFLVFGSLLLTSQEHAVPEDYLILDTYRSGPAWNNSMPKTEFKNKLTISSNIVIYET